MTNIQLIWQFIVAHQLIIFGVFSGIVSMLPPPLPGERWYGFAYDVLHLGAQNWAKVFSFLRIERKT